MVEIEAEMEVEEGWPNRIEAVEAAEAFEVVALDF